MTIEEPPTPVQVRETIGRMAADLHRHFFMRTRVIETREVDRTLVEYEYKCSCGEMVTS